ncbi:MAG: hypothetical protein NTZ05_21350, partial [Chloroflexi bacterium]|nr:hypothetical protein [Chloroflexota bacterium]
TANSDVTVNGTNLGAFATDVSVTTITTSPNGTRLVITSPVAVTSGATATVVLTTPVVRLPNVVQAVNTVNVCTAVPAFAVAAATANQCLVGGTNIKDVVNPATPGTNGSTGTPISLTNASAAFPATTTGTINMGTGAGNAVLLDPTSASTTSINNTTLIDLSFNNANNAAGIQHEIPTNGSIVVVFPKNLGPFGLSGVTAAVQAAGNAATLAVGVASQGSNTTDGRQTLIIPVTTQTGATPNAAASRYFRLRLTGVVLPGTAGTAGSVGDTFDVCTRATNATTNGCTSDGAGIASSYANQLIDAATNVGTFVVNPAPLSGTSVTLSNNAAGAVNSLTANFQTANPWPDSGRLVVLLPTGLGSWTLPGAGTTLSASSPTANIGALTVTSSANKLIVQRVGGGTISGTFSVTIANVQNPLSPGLGAAMGNYKLCTGNTTFDTTDCTLGGTTTGAVIDFTAAAGTTLTNSGGLSVVSISQTSVNTGAGANYTFNFTPSQSWPANGRFVAVFPAGYTISSGSPPVATFGSANGGLTVSVTGTTVSVTRTGTGTAIAAATAVSLTLTGGITNPATAGASGSFSLATQQPSGGGYANLDIATITGPTIVVPTSPTINAGVGAGNGLDFAAGVNRSAIGQGVAGRVLTITGTNFVSLPTITTSNAGMTVGTVTFVSATQLTVPLTASATASGTFTVTVTNPN